MRTAVQYVEYTSTDASSKNTTTTFFAVAVAVAFDIIQGVSLADIVISRVLRVDCTRFGTWTFFIVGCQSTSETEVDESYFPFETHLFPITVAAVGVFATINVGIVVPNRIIRRQCAAYFIP